MMIRNPSVFLHCHRLASLICAVSGARGTVWRRTTATPFTSGDCPCFLSSDVHRSVWHVAVVELGYYPDPYGLGAEDGRHIRPDARQVWRHLQLREPLNARTGLPKKEFFSIWEKGRGFVIRSFLRRLMESVAGSTQTSVRSILFFSGVTQSGGVPFRAFC